MKSSHGFWSLNLKRKQGYKICFTFSALANGCLGNNMFVKINLTGVDRWYHAALACQLLDVQAIPTDLEKYSTILYRLDYWLIQTYLRSSSAERCELLFAIISTRLSEISYM